MVSGTCWICNQFGELTGEHKFKASDLRNQFGKDPMYKFKNGASFDEKALLQGVKSNQAKFTPSICAKCNNEKTQPADKAYDLLVIHSQEAIFRGAAPSTVFDSEPFNDDNSATYINTFRYFGKLLGCHIIDVGLPVPDKIQRFVNNQTDELCIWLRLFEDTYVQKVSDAVSDLTQELDYTAHGGLTIPFNKKTAVPESFLSTQTVGKAGFEFWSDIDESYLKLHYKRELPL